MYLKKYLTMQVEILNPLDRLNVFSNTYDGWHVDILCPSL